MMVIALMNLEQQQKIQNRIIQLHLLRIPKVCVMQCNDLIAVELESCASQTTQKVWLFVPAIRNKGAWNRRREE